MVFLKLNILAKLSALLCSKIFFKDITELNIHNINFSSKMKTTITNKQNKTKKLCTLHNHKGICFDT